MASSEAPESQRSELMDYYTHLIQKDELKPGDHIYSWRFCYTYAHHGIYINDRMVINFTESLLTSRCRHCRKGNVSGVISSDLESFLRGGKIYRYKYGVPAVEFLFKVRGGCTTAPSDPAKDVIHRAEFLLQKGFKKYNLYENNCEDFALYCKTGYLITFGKQGKSSQAKLAKAVTYAAIESPFSISTFTKKCSKYRYENDLGVRTDKEKVAVEDLVAE